MGHKFKACIVKDVIYFLFNTTTSIGEFVNVSALDARQCNFAEFFSIV